MGPLTPTGEQVWAGKGEETWGSTDDLGTPEGTHPLSSSIVPRALCGAPGRPPCLPSPRTATSQSVAWALARSRGVLCVPTAAHRPEPATWPESPSEFDSLEECDFGAFAPGAWILFPWPWFSQGPMNAGQQGLRSRWPGPAGSARLMMPLWIRTPDPGHSYSSSKAAPSQG